MLLDQLRLLHQDGNLGDDDEPHAAADVLLAPSARARGTSRARSRRLRGSSRRGSTTMPPVGKSGPGMNLSSRRLLAFGFSIRCSAASHSSATLCGGIVVAMPTAMPVEPLASKFGKRRRQHDRLFRLRRRRSGGNRPRPRRCLRAAARDLGHAAFGVAHGGGVIAVDVAEIALAVDQRIARGEILREAHQRVVDRLVAVRVELAHHVADDLGGFLERGAGVEPQQAHRVEDAAVHRLQAVAHIRQRAAA